MTTPTSGKRTAGNDTPASQSAVDAAAPAPPSRLRRLQMRQMLWPTLALAALAAGMFSSWRSKELRPADDLSQSAIDELLSGPLVDADQNPIDRSNWQGRILVLNFWATWCPPCVEEMPELSQLANEVQSASIQIIGIGIDSAANIRQFAQKHRISYPLPVVGAAGIEMVRALGNAAGGLPFTVVLDVNRRITARYLGRLNMGELRSHLGQLPRG